MSRPTPLSKQHDAVFQLLDDDGNEQPIEAPKSSGEKHAERLNRQTDERP